MPGTTRLPISLPRLPLRTKATTQQRLWQTLDVFRHVLLLLFILRHTRRTLLHLRGYGVLGSPRLLYRDLHRKLYALFLRLPFVQAKAQAQVRQAIGQLEEKLVPSGPGVTQHTSLPAAGWSSEQIRAELGKLGELKRARWEEGRVSGAVYHGGEELLELQSEAMKNFGVSNPLHPDVFPGVRKMEAEIVAMTLGLFNAPATGAGVTTSGGTESIIMSVLAARQQAYTERGVTRPEILVPNTAHAAFWKAASYFNIIVHKIPCPGPSYKVHIPSVSRLINSNTVLLVGSAPNFPHGIIDDIPSLSRLALAHNIPLHVDCCLGSFLVPFLARAGFPSPEGGFDFRLPGVTQISVDTHKYGFAPKGNSVILYRSAELRKYQYHILPEWSGGVYASPTIAGSRPGALIAGCWASLMRMGEEGYLDSCVRIVGAAKRIEEAIRSSEILRHSVAVMGKPMVSVVAFRAKEAAQKALGSGHEVDIYDIADAMSAKGWHLNALQDPPAIHVAVTLPIVAAVEDLVRDLEACVLACRGKGKEGGKKGDAAALYGVAGAIPDKSIVVELATGFLDTLYKTERGTVVVGQQIVS